MKIVECTTVVICVISNMHQNITIKNIKHWKKKKNHYHINIEFYSDQNKKRKINKTGFDNQTSLLTEKLKAITII